MIIQRYAVIDPINLGNNLGIFMIIMMDNNDDYPMVTQPFCNYVKKYHNVVSHDYKDFFLYDDRMIQSAKIDLTFPTFPTKLIPLAHEIYG